MKPKQIILRKVLALLLVSVMLLSLMPFTVFADGADSKAANASQVPMLGGANAFGFWALQNLGSGFLSSLGGKGADAAFAAIFGAETDPVMEKLEEISNKLDKISDSINQMIKQNAEGQLYDILNDYQSFIGPYEAILELMRVKRELFADDPVNTKYFLMDVYTGQDNNFKMNGDTIFILTLKLTKKILQVYNNEYNLFGAFDKLERHINRWEHQGYQAREDFQDSVICFYVEFMTLAQLACKTAMEDVPEGSYHYINRSSDLNQLIDYAKQVSEMYKRCAVIRHPDLRIIRDTVSGINQYALYANVNAVGPIDPPDPGYRWERRWLPYGRRFLIKDEEYLMSCMGCSFLVSENYHGPGGHEYVTDQLHVDAFQEIRGLFGNTKSLYDIFFDPNEGNFINTGNLSRGARYATNYYIMKKYGSFPYEDYCWYTNVVNDNAELNNTVGLITACKESKVSGKEWLGYLSPEKLFNVRLCWKLTQSAPMFPGGNPQPNESAYTVSGMDYSYLLPYNDTVVLSAEESDENNLNIENARYQWFVNKGTPEGDVKTAVTEDGKTITFLIDENGENILYDTENGEFEEIEGATEKSYTLPALEASMAGWQYYCFVYDALWQPDDAFDDSLCTYTSSVQLNLHGEGVPETASVPEVGNAEELTAALEDKFSVKLTADINYPHPISMRNGRSITIDLNGHTLTVEPKSDAAPNINPESDNEATAAIYAQSGGMNISGDGALNIVAGNGIDYGIYAADYGNVTVSNVTLTDGGCAVYCNNSFLNILGDISASGNNASAVYCLGNSILNIDGNASANGNSASCAYVESFADIGPRVSIIGNLSASGEKSKGATVAGRAALSVSGNVTVTGNNSEALSVSGDGASVQIDGDIIATGNGTAGIFAIGRDGSNTIEVKGSITSPDTAINASCGAAVSVGGNVVSTDENASTIYAYGSTVEVGGDVTANDIAIIAGKWDLNEPVIGGLVTVDGTVTAYTPLCIESMSLNEDEGVTDGEYSKFTDDVSSIFAKSLNTLVEPDTTIIMNKDGVQFVAGDGVFPEGTTVSIEKLTPGNLFTLVQSAMDGVAGKFTAFNITATNGNVIVQPNGTATVTFDIPDGYNMDRLAVYRVAPDGSKQKSESSVDKDAKTITVLSDSLSVYVLAEMLPETNPQPGDTFPYILLIVLIIVSAAGIVYSSFRLNRKRTVY